MVILAMVVMTFLAMQRNLEGGYQDFVHALVMIIQELHVHYLVEITPLHDLVKINP